jgi:hypothetical protein
VRSYVEARLGRAEHMQCCRKQSCSISFGDAVMLAIISVCELLLCSLKVASWQHWSRMGVGMCTSGGGSVAAEFFGHDAVVPVSTWASDCMFKCATDMSCSFRYFCVLQVTREQC